MTMNTQLIDGQLDLDAQQRTLNFLEQATFAKVINYSKTQDAANKTTPNEAVLQDVPIGQQPGPLHLEAVDAGEDAIEIVSLQLRAGKVVVFHETIYVSSKELLVLGFR